jgi:hypothetical protein
MWQARQKCSRQLVWLVVLLWVPGCRLFSLPPRAPTLYRTERLPLLINSDFRLPPHPPLLDELVALNKSMAFVLDLPPSQTPVHVDVFETPTAYRAYMAEHFPEFPDRRAFFVESDGRLAVYAFWGDRVAEDLRHEVAHAYLHAVIPAVPLWLDEGLAEYFEVSPQDRGLNRPHLVQLTAAIDRCDWWPDIGRLAAIEAVAPMTQRDYAEAWAWVHFCLHTTAARRASLCGYLRQLRSPHAEMPPAGEFVATTERDVAALIDHLMALRSATIARERDAVRAKGRLPDSSRPEVNRGNGTASWRR